MVSSLNRALGEVIEADTVPKTFINKTRMRLPIPGGGAEPIGNRIIELPEDRRGD